MVGVGTALADDPALTVRLPGLDLKPLRVVLDTHLRLPDRSRLAATARDVPTLVIAGPSAPSAAANRLADLGVIIERVGARPGRPRRPRPSLAGARPARDHPRVQRGRPARRRPADRA